MDKVQAYTDAIVKALENPRYKRRTVSGVATETGLPTDVVTTVLSKNVDTVVQSTVPSTNGERLFTTRKHLLQTASTVEKLAGAIRNPT